MKKRLVYTLAAGALIAGLFVALTLPASAEYRTVTVRLKDGTVTQVPVKVPKGTPLNKIRLPGGSSGGGKTGGGETGSGGKSGGGSTKGPAAKGKGKQSPSGKKGTTKTGKGTSSGGATSKGENKGRRRGAKRRHRGRAPIRKADGTPTRSNPSFFDALPGPSSITGVPNFVIRKFRVPIFLLPIYQAAAIQYGLRWEILAAINEIETDYGRNLNVSSAGALGWMQFMPATWRAYGVDANRDGRKDPYNPVDAIFAAARYLKAAGAEKNLRKGIFAYNHADWYVDSVLLRARLIAGVPGDLVSSLTGLTEGRFPVDAHARYADDISEREAEKRFRRGQNAARVIEGSATRRGLRIFARKGAPVIAVNDGVVKRMGRRAGGWFLVLQDVYGNRYQYSGLGSVVRSYPVPRQDERSVRVESSPLPTKDRRPSRAASAGRQKTASARRRVRPKANAPRPTSAFKERLFANPQRARGAGGEQQLADSQPATPEPADDGFSTFRNYFSSAFGLAGNRRDVRMERLRTGSRLVGGTVLGRIGKTVPSKAPNVYFEIKPAGRGAPKIDPKPILDGWKLLEATAIYRANGRNALYGDSDSFSIGQILLLPKPLLQKRVLSDERIDVYGCGRQDIRSGQVDRRVLATLEYLAESGMRPTVTSLKCGHSKYTSSGNISHHSSGNAVDIAKINGVPILGHQERGGITEQAVRRLMLLQGTMRPAQIISLLDIGSNTLSMRDHADHIHVGFRPLFGSNAKLGKQALAVLKPGQWNDLLKRLRKIENPQVPVKPSKYALPAGKAKKKQQGD